MNPRSRLALSFFYDIHLGCRHDEYEFLFVDMKPCVKRRHALGRSNSYLSGNLPGESSFVRFYFYESGCSFLAKQCFKKHFRTGKLSPEIWKGALQDEILSFLPDKDRSLFCECEGVECYSNTMKFLS